MRIGIDARTLSEGGGCRTYVLNLLKHLLLIDHQNDYIIFYNDKKFLGRFHSATECVVRPRCKLLLLYYDHISVPINAKKFKLDIIHTPKSATSFFYWKTKNVVSILDTIPLDFPQTEKLVNKIYWNIQIPIAVRMADKIITISNSSKLDLMKKYKLPDSKIQVIYLGYDQQNMKVIDKMNSTLEDIKNKYKLPNTFILYVGTIQPRKNLIMLFKAFLNIKNKIPHKIVIVGRKGWLQDELFNFVSKNNLVNDIQFTGFVPDDDISYIYNLADIFVYPSMYEGFGLPVLEAMACGVPTITTNISSLPEVAGNAAVMINPTDVTQLAKKILLIHSDLRFKKKLIHRGLERTKQFSWTKCAQETLAVYQSLN